MPKMIAGLLAYAPGEDVDSMPNVCSRCGCSLDLAAGYSGEVVGTLVLELAKRRYVAILCDVCNVEVRKRMTSGDRRRSRSLGLPGPAAVRVGARVR